jgi:hypothetical protein
MKKFFFFGLAVLGIAILATVNVNLGNKNSNESVVFLKNLEALTQETSNSYIWYTKLPVECCPVYDAFTGTYRDGYKVTCFAGEEQPYCVDCYLN